MEKYFQDVANGANPALPPVIFAPENANETLDLLQLFANDSIQQVKLKALELIGGVIRRSENDVVRNRGVHLMLRTGDDPMLMSVSLDLLKRFHKKDFTDSSKNIVRKHVRADGSYLKEWIKMAAFLELKDLVSIIRPLSQPGNAAGLRWAAIISLARMDDPAAVSEMINRVNRRPVNDDLVYQIFPDLIFTRKREAISFMVEAMQDEAKNCLSADAEKEFTIPCGYRIMEQLAPVIDGFPLPIAAGGDLQTNDYPAALETVRTWFRTNTQYKILSNTY